MDDVRGCEGEQSETVYQKENRWWQRKEFKKKRDRWLSEGRYRAMQ